LPVERSHQAPTSTSTAATSRARTTT
jgi:hypothetical protein